MSVGPLGMASSFAGTTQSRGSDVERSQQETSAQDRSVKSAEQAESAAGIGETTEDQESQERDADGRRLWENAGGKPAGEEPAEEGSGDVRASKDATGDRGVNLDLSG